MKRNRTRALLAGALLVALLAASGCSTAPPDTEKRLTALEAEVKSLREDARAREKNIREQLTLVRDDLASIRALLEAGGKRAGGVEPPAGDHGAAADSDDALDRELDAKAKGFVKENLDRLLVITRKLLDKMERELDEQPQTAPPAEPGNGEI